VTAAVLLVGATGGLGLAFVAWGLWPPRPGLAAALQLLRRPAPPRPSAAARARAALAHPLARVGLPAPRMLRDLAVLGRDPAGHLAAQATAALAGLLGAPLLAAAVTRGATATVPAVAAVVGAAGGLWLVEHQARQRAARLRADLVHTLAALLDLVTVSLAGGAGVEQALADATGIAQGWAAGRLRAALATARLTGTPPWQAFGELGTATGVPELEELAASLSLAGSEGARVRASLAARAHALRTRQTIAMQAAANAATERMALPLMVLGAAYMIFLLYPAVSALGGAL